MNIKEASEKTDVSMDTIRYYERIGLIMPIERHHGIRKFQERNLNQILFAKTMRKAGLTIETLKQYVTLVFEDEHHTIPKRKEILEKAIASLDKKIMEIQKARDYLKWKVDHYDTAVREAEKKIK